jgi:hypothetical protein
VHFAETDARWLAADTAALITYIATARWDYEPNASKTHCATVYVQLDRSWKVAFHQQTPVGVDEQRSERQP